RARRPIDARRAWARAIDVIDPEGLSLERDPWLAQHLHFWVAREWLRSGAWCTARSIIDQIPDDILVRADIGRRGGFNDMIISIAHEEVAAWQDFHTWLESQDNPRWAPVAELIKTLRVLIPKLPPPMARKGEDGPNLTWSRPGVHVELEVIEFGLVDWFARDRIDGRSEGVDIATSWNDEALLRWLREAARE
ncbi:MAG: hypothetical protein KC457_24185, partial [Myxococcales bacterium]|nr:hypothetical protein [Myxococcales bacterium]